MTENSSVNQRLMDLLGVTQYEVDKILDMVEQSKVPENKRKHNDFAVAKALNERAIRIFTLVADNNGLPDVTDINRLYVLIVNDLKALYAATPELEAIDKHICWQSFDMVDVLGDNFWEYSRNVEDYGQTHNAKVNRLCITAGVDKPTFTTRQRKLITDADKAIASFSKAVSEINERKTQEKQERTWIIPVYKFEFTDSGTLLINGKIGVLKTKKVNAASAPEKLLEQARKRPNELFKPEIGQVARSLGNILGDMGFTGVLKDLFFPVAKGGKIKFRPIITREQAVAEGLDTFALDTKLQALGAKTDINPATVPF